MNHNRIMTDPKYTAMSILLTALLCGSLLMIPLPGLYGLTMTLFFFPVFLLCIAAVTGWLGGLASTLVVILFAYQLSGTMGAGIASLFFLPTLLLFLKGLDLRLDYKKLVVLMTFTYIASVLSAYLLLRSVYGQNLFAVFAQKTVDYLAELPERDQYFYAFWKYNLLRLDVSDQNAVFNETGGSWTFLPWVLEEFYNQIRNQVERWLTLILPSLVSSYSFLLSTLGTAFALRYARKTSQRIAFRSPLPFKGEDLCPSLNRPPLSHWYLTKKQGFAVMGLAGGYLLISAKNPGLILSGQMMFNAFSTIYFIQGLSFAMWWMNERSVRSFWKNILCLLFYFTAQNLLMWVGLGDQLFDFRRLRTPPASDDHQRFDSN